MPVETLVDEKRLKPSRDSMWRYKEMRSDLNEIQVTLPWLSGYSFFGSKVKGTDSYGSDFDLCVYYDSSHSNFRSATLSDRNIIIMRIWSKVQNRFDHRLMEFGSGLWIDLSPKKTLEELRSCIFSINDELNKSVEDLTSQQLKDLSAKKWIQNLYSRFFLGVGDEVYRNRQFILDYLEELENGEQYFEILMSCLRHFENTSKREDIADRTIDSLPKSIAEARQYFVLRKSREIFQPT